MPFRYAWAILCTEAEFLHLTLAVPFRAAGPALHRLLPPPHTHTFALPVCCCPAYGAQPRPGERRHEQEQ